MKFIKKYFYKMAILFSLLCCLSSICPVISYASFNKKTEISVDTGEQKFNSKGFTKAVDAVKSATKIFVNLLKEVGLVMLVVGIGFYILSYTHDDPHSRERGLFMMVIGAILFGMDFLNFI